MQSIRLRAVEENFERGSGEKRKRVTRLCAEKWGNPNLLFAFISTIEFHKKKGQTEEAIVNKPGWAWQSR